VRFRKHRFGASVVSASLIASLALVACGSSGTSASSSSTTAGSSGTSAPGSQSTAGNTASAPGVTPTTVTVGQIADISEPVPGLFKSSQVALQAYAAYVNAQGGVYGRKIIVDSRDSQFNPATITSDAQDIAAHDLAFVGNYTLFDVGMQPTIDAQHVPNISVAIGSALANDPNTYSPTPSTLNDYALGPYEWLKQKYPQAIQHVGVMYSGATASTKQSWVVQQQALQHLGYNIVYARGFTPAETTFDSDILKMKAEGVQLFLGVAFPDNYAATFARELAQQNFKPIDVESAAYGSNLVPLSGGTAEGMYLVGGTALFLGQDSTAVPAVATFDKYMKQIDSTDSIALWGATSWAAAALFVQALKNAGQNPTRASLVAALNKITNFNAGGLIAASNPAQNVPGSCWLLAQVKNGQIQRVPPTPSNTFICNPGDMLPINGWTPENRS